MLLVRHDKHVYKINSKEQKISCHSLKFSLESLLFVGIYKNFKVHTYINLCPLLDEKTWFGDNPMTSSIIGTS